MTAAIFSCRRARAVLRAIVCDQGLAGSVVLGRGTDRRPRTGTGGD